MISNAPDKCFDCEADFGDCECPLPSPREINRMRWKLQKLETERSKIAAYIVDDDEWYDDFNEDDLFEYVLDRIVQEGAKRPKEFQLELFEIVHQGTSRYLDRINWGVSEKVFHDKWLEENAPSRHGGTLLPMIADRPITQNDATLVASVIQWLGTNCGYGFLWECQRRIDSIDSQTRAIQDHVRQQEWKKQNPDKHDEDGHGFEQAGTAAAIANGVLQKMSIDIARNSFGRKGLDEAKHESLVTLLEVAGVRTRAITFEDE